MSEIEGVGLADPRLVNGKCPFCVEMGIKSMVECGGCSTTLMSTRSWYDEDGHYHFDNPNITTRSYSCSNNHAWSQPANE